MSPLIPLSLSQPQLDPGLSSFPSSFAHSVFPSSAYKTSNQVLSLFSTVKPGGGTPTGTRLEALLSAHIELLERAKASAGRGMPKPLNVVILTDGEPRYVF